MNPRTEVPEWCRAELEDAISDAVTRWVLDRVDRMGENATPTNALSVIFALTAGDRQEVARDVIAALQGVGVPFSGATGAGAEWEPENGGAERVFTKLRAAASTLAAGRPQCPWHLGETLTLRPDNGLWQCNTTSRTYTWDEVR